MKAKVSYLNHSGFIVETAGLLAVFDLYTDPAGVLAQYTNCGKPAVFFVSHTHYDHWNEGILLFENTVPNLYIMEEACRSDKVDVLVQQCNNRIIYVKPYEHYSSEDLGIEALKSLHTFGSTDEGVSFLLDTDFGAVYHAGDLNEWDWQDEDSAAVKQAYRHELSLIKDALAGEACVLAFVPVDQRLGETAFAGAMTLLEYFLPRYLIPMHLNGGEDLPGILRRKLRAEVEYDGTHVVAMTLPGMPLDIYREGEQ